MTSENGTVAAAEPVELKSALDSVLSQIRDKPVSSRVGDELAAQERSKRSAEWSYVVAKIGKRYAGCTLGNFVATTPAQKQAVQQIGAYVGNWPVTFGEGRGLLLYGPSGTGKDHLAVAALAVAVKDHGATVACIDGQSLFERMRDSIDSETKERDVIRDYTTPHILMISDPLPQSGTVKDFQQSALWRIVDRRYRDMRPTWVTLNVKDEAEAQSRMGVQLVDRLTDGALCIHCNWPSYRKPAAVVKG